MRDLPEDFNKYAQTEAEEMTRSVRHISKERQERISGWLDEYEARERAIEFEKRQSKEQQIAEAVQQQKRDRRAMTLKPPMMASPNKSQEQMHRDAERHVEQVEQMEAESRRQELVSKVRECIDDGVRENQRTQTNDTNDPVAALEQRMRAFRQEHPQIDFRRKR